MIEMSLTLIAGLAVLSFLAELIDSSLGMGYGTTLTPILLAIGFLPLQAVPAVLVSELFTGFFAAFLFHRLHIIRLDFRNDPESAMVRRLGKLGYMPRSQDSRISFVLIVCSVLGTIIAVFIALNISRFYLKLIIGVIVLLMGIIILLKRNDAMRFSWVKIVGLGAVAAFNKGLSGGGYGPLVTSGQILSGVKSKNSVAICSFAEAFTCLIGVLAYLVLGQSVDWTLAPILTAGALCSVPLAALIVKKVDMRQFTFAVGIATLLLGAYTLYSLLG
jgi:uncharacterized membrane protein YfcA